MGQTMQAQIDALDKFFGPRFARLDKAVGILQKQFKKMYRDCEVQWNFEQFYGRSNDNENGGVPLVSASIHVSFYTGKGKKRRTPSGVTLWHCTNLASVSQERMDRLADRVLARLSDDLSALHDVWVAYCTARRPSTSWESVPFPSKYPLAYSSPLPEKRNGGTLAD